MQVIQTIKSLTLLSLVALFCSASASEITGEDDDDALTIVKSYKKLERCEEMLSVRPNSVGLRLMRAEILCVEGHMVRAKPELEQLAKDNPDSFFVNNSLAHFYTISGDTQQALIALNAAEKANPKQFENHIRYLLLDDREKAKEILLKAKNKRGVGSFAVLRYADLLLMEGDAKAAYHILSEIENFNSESEMIMVRFKQGVCLLANRQFDEAHALFAVLGSTNYSGSGSEIESAIVLTSILTRGCGLPLKSHGTRVRGNSLYMGLILEAYLGNAKIDEAERKILSLKQFVPRSQLVLKYSFLIAMFYALKANEVLTGAVSPDVFKELLVGYAKAPSVPTRFSFLMDDYYGMH